MKPPSHLGVNSSFAAGISAGPDLPVPNPPDFQARLPLLTRKGTVLASDINHSKQKKNVKTSQTSSVLCPAKGIVISLDTTFTIEKGILYLLQAMSDMPPTKSEKQKAIHISCRFLIFKLKITTLQDGIPKHHLDPATLHSQVSFTHKRSHIKFLPFLPRFWSALVLKGILSSNFLEKRKAGHELCKPTKVSNPHCL